MNKIFLGSLPGNLVERDIEQYFCQFAQVLRVSLKKKTSVPYSNRGFAHLTVASAHDVESILSQEHYFLGRKIKCMQYVKGEELEAAKLDLENRRVFLTGLPLSVTDQELRLMFSQFGDIESGYRTKQQSTQQLSCFGYVTFRHFADADYVLQLKHLWIHGVRIRIYPFAKTTGQRKQTEVSGICGSELKKPKSYFDEQSVPSDQLGQTKKNKKVAEELSHFKNEGHSMNRYSDQKDFGERPLLIKSESKKTNYFQGTNLKPTSKDYHVPGLEAHMNHSNANLSFKMSGFKKSFDKYMGNN